MRSDALIVGAGPAGSAMAVLLAQRGWSVVLVEQSVFPRQKVCGECISAGSLTLLDALGIGAEFRQQAGPELRRIGWIGPSDMIVADFPPCSAGAYPYGRAIGRDRLDEFLLERARSLGVCVLQPAKVRSVSGGPGGFTCNIEFRGLSKSASDAACGMDAFYQAAVVIDAHGSWEGGPALFTSRQGSASRRTPRHDSDLFAFKASFGHSPLEPGLLPVIAFEGGYGGMVVAEEGRTTFACCIRRDTLRACRSRVPGVAASNAVVQLLRRSCPSLRDFFHTVPDGAWFSVGPIRPGIRVDHGLDIFRIGNAAGETHPLIGEGISMALQSAALLASHLAAAPVRTLDQHCVHAINRRYGAAWRHAFAPRLRFAAGYAHATMHPSVTTALHGLVERWPSLLTRAARWAGKSRGSIVLAA